jgi:peptidoglycan/LPS O-acetylase OafA/YrhL
VTALPSATAIPGFSASASIMLDTLRSGASQVVVIGHAISFLGIWPALQPPRAPYVQDIGVVVFFVLSGLLITHTTRMKLGDDRRPYAPRDFFIDRASRIYTAFLPALVLVVGIDAVGRRLVPERYGSYLDASGVWTFLGNVLMLQDFPGLEGGLARFGGPTFELTSYGTARPFWTIAVEWWIYLLVGWLLVVRATGRRRSPWTPVVVIATVPFLIVPFHHLVGGRGNGLTAVWMFGALGSYAWPVLARSRVPSVILLGAGATFGAGACAVLYVTGHEAYHLGFGLAVAVAVALAVAGLRADVDAGAFWHRVVVAIAAYSFTLYLLHYSVTVFALAWLDPSVLSLVILVVVCNLVAALVAAVTERNYPIVRRRLRSHLGGPRREVATVARPGSSVGSG